MDATTTSTTLADQIRRGIGIGYGIGNQLLFLVTVWYLFWFLRDGSITGRHGNWIVRDCALAIVFAVSHSVMLIPATRKHLSRWIPQPFYETTFCVVTCVSLLVMFFGWHTSETTLWQTTGLVQTLVQWCFLGCWAALFYSLALTGLGYQNGWTPFYYWLRRQTPPRREFKPRGAYRLIRHPVYLSFLGLVWFTPRMTLDHAALTGIWTAYIFYGSFLKDQRLKKFIGRPYRDYATDVPGWPMARRLAQVVQRFRSACQPFAKANRDACDRNAQEPIDSSDPGQQMTRPSERRIAA